MTGYFTDLKYKEIIDIRTGLRFGYVCDLEFDESTGQLLAMVTPGRERLFGLLGREEDYILPWSSIVKVGNDIVLVEAKGELLRRKRQRRLF